MKRPVRLVISAVAVLIGACATTPSTMPEIEQARARVESLAQDPRAQVVSKELNAARAALAQADQALEKRQKREIIVHLAYLADRQAEIGQTRIEEAAARERIAAAEAERNKVLLQAREAEARTAQDSAQASREATLQARTELEDMRRQFAELQAKQTERGMVLTLGDVLFDTAQATLKPGAAVAIDRLATFLNRNQNTRIVIEGHTDNVGSDAYNSELSRRRAQAVADALVSQGIPSTRFEVLGRGEGFPVATNDTPAGRQQNRRVEIVFSDPDGKLGPAQPQP